MFSTSQIELDYQALKSNLNYIKKLLAKDVKYSSVVKGNAYGHGIHEFVPMLEAAGVNHFSVFSADEAFAVANSTLSRADIMIMGYIENEELEWAIQNDISFFVFEVDRLHAAINMAKKLDKRARIHIELETGLNRTGFDQPTLTKVIELIKSNEQYLFIEGDCTHYAGAENISNHYRVSSQIDRFEKLDKWLKSHGVVPKYNHTACSAASVRYPQTQMDMVRIGILQYGFWPSRETFIEHISGINRKDDPLKRVIKWSSKVMDVKEVVAGEYIGYGSTFMAPDNMKIATVPVGYCHGYSRSLSNQGRVLIRGTRLAVIGIVNMNLLIVDISEKPEIEKNDEVVLIGDQGESSITVASFGELSVQLNYELLTRLPRDIPRTVINQD